MEVTFGANQVPADAVTPATTAAPTPAPVSQVPAVQQAPGVPATNSLLLGDRLPTFSDVILPRLNLVQNIGELKDSFEPGGIVLAQTTLLFIAQRVNTKTQIVETPASPPVIITVLGFKPMRFCEKVGGGVRGLIVNSEAEVRSAGGTLDWAEWNMKKEAGMKRFEPLADALVLIQRPAAIAPPAGEDDPVFVYEVEGNNYALAFWALRGVGYTAAAKRVLFPARLTGCLRKGGYPSWSYALTSREETYQNGNKAWVPVLLPNKHSTPKMLEFVSSVLNPQAGDSATAAQ